MSLDRDAADLRRPANLETRLRHVEQIVAEGLTNNDRGQFVLAALEYQSILADPGFDSNDPNCPEIQASLGALLCLIAQTEEPGPRRLDFLTRAQVLLGKALDRYQKTMAPLSWARIRANLAIVLLATYEQTDAAAELFSALMTLDGVAEVFARAGDLEAEDWVYDISRRLDDLRNRRR